MCIAPVLASEHCSIRKIAMAFLFLVAIAWKVRTSYAHASHRNIYIIGVFIH